MLPVRLSELTCLVRTRSNDESKGMSPVTRNKEEIRLWGLSGASVWALCIFSFTRYGERKNTVWASPFSVSPTQPALGLLVRDFRLASQRSPEKTEEGDAQTEAPGRPQSLISVSYTHLTLPTNREV